MNQCEPGDRACQNVRRYYQSDFKRPSPYERIKEAVKTVKDVTKGVQETAGETLTIQLFLDTGFFLIIPTVAFIWLAIQGIKRDEMLVNSLDRLR